MSKLKVKVDKSETTINKFKERLAREAKTKAEQWNAQIGKNSGLNLGTRKNLNSILKKASTKSRKIQEELDRHREERNKKK